LTPSIFFRIAPILLLAPQEKHPGTVNCTTLSVAQAMPAKDIKKMNVRKTLDIFFIIHSAMIINFSPVTIVESITPSHARMQS
jgi:hypothetical protein